MYFNVRTEVWGWMRDSLKAGAEIPDDPELAVDLTAPLKQQVGPLPSKLLACNDFHFWKSPG